MTDQHPLTDDVGRAIEEDLVLDWAMDYDEYMCMRAGADWQLKQVIEWLEGNLGFSFYLERHFDGVSEVDVDYVIDDFKKAMRPITPPPELRKLDADPPTTKETS